MRTFLVKLSAGVGLALAVTACGPLPGMEEEKKDPATACTDMCNAAGYSGGTADVHDHETNCSCSGGSGTVSDQQCTDMCTSIDLGNADTYSSVGGAINSCQCS